MLEQIPDAVREKYGILAYPVDSNGKQGLFLFWRPELQLRNYYYGYKGTEISALQEMLAERNLYDDHIDGIVGKNLTASIKRFQSQMSLPVTGLPDDRTLFLISQKGGHGRP